MRILLAKEAALLGDGLRAGLRQLGFLVDWVRDGEGMRMPDSLQGRLLALVPGLVVGVWRVSATWTWLDVRHEQDEIVGRPFGPGRGAAGGATGERD